MPSTRIYVAIAIGLLWATSAVAESRPPLASVVRRNLLIVKCQVEIKDNLLNYRVLETWKGNYSPEIFEQQPPKGYVLARPQKVGAARDSMDGREVILFYSDNALAGSAHKPRKLNAYRMDDSIPILDGKVRWEIERDLGGEEYTLAEFKKAVLDIVAHPDRGRDE